MNLPARTRITLTTIAAICLFLGSVQILAQDSAAMFEASCATQLKDMQDAWKVAGRNGPVVSSRYSSIAAMDARAIQTELMMTRSDATPQARATNAWELCLLRTRQRQLAQSSNSRPAALPTARTSAPENMSHENWTGKPFQSYKYPGTNNDCVTPTRGPDSGQLGKLVFQNICGRLFRVHVQFSDGVTKHDGLGIGTLKSPATMVIFCEKQKGQCDGSIDWYED